jgi:hypothetical protein
MIISDSIIKHTAEVSENNLMNSLVKEISPAVLDQIVNAVVEKLLIELKEINHEL